MRPSSLTVVAVTIFSYGTKWISRKKSF